MKARIQIQPDVLAGVRKRRQQAGVLFFDSLRFWRMLLSGAWMLLRNRNEAICLAPDGMGCYIDAPWSSDLHACRVFPRWGRLIFRCAEREWPFHLEYDRRPILQASPRATFIIPHRGRDRLPLLQAVVASIRGQDAVPVECIVVEQNSLRELLESDLPPDVRYLHLPHPSDAKDWHFAWAFNEGARQARSDILVLHDGDIIAPRGYAREIVRHLRRDWEAVYLQRFLFCLNAADSESLQQSGVIPPAPVPERVRQNWKGGTRAVRHETFRDVGGMDESFVGWGGEDVEFFDRLLARRTRRFGYLPFLHLWHPPQRDKMSGRRERNLKRLNAVLAEPRARRIARLRDHWTRRRADIPPPMDMES